jgi:hypothetical protein
MSCAAGLAYMMWSVCASTDHSMSGSEVKMLVRRSRAISSSASVRRFSRRPLASVIARSTVAGRRTRFDFST